MQIIQAVKSLEPRVVLLVKLANTYITNKNRSAGLAILREADTWIGKVKPSPDLASAILAIGEAYFNLNDRNQGQAAITLAIEWINLSVDGREWEFLEGSSRAAGTFHTRHSMDESKWWAGFSNSCIPAPGGPA